LYNSTDDGLVDGTVVVEKDIQGVYQWWRCIGRAQIVQKLRMYRSMRE